MDKNTKIEEFIKNLTDEEYLELVKRLSPAPLEFSNSQLIPIAKMPQIRSIDYSNNRDNYTLSHVYYDDFKNVKKIEFNTFSSPVLTETEELHYTNSMYEAKWMYPNVFGNAKMAYMEMLLQGMDFSDQIDSDHEQYSYFFNMHRDNVGLPRIELKVGSLYELQFGRKRDIIKRMTLVDIKGGLNSNKIPELYFENENNFYSNNCHRTNINHIKIWRKIEDGRDK